jgi:hypothetical protein
MEQLGVTVGNAEMDVCEVDANDATDASTTAGSVSLDSIFCLQSPRLADLKLSPAHK